MKELQERGSQVFRTILCINIIEIVQQMLYVSSI
nr:MAG TPA: hypothetical protein [Caudoviricetes sp.]